MLRRRWWVYLGGVMLLLFFLAALPRVLPLHGQTPPGKWTVGTMMGFVRHSATPDDSSPEQYDVKVRVGNIDFVVLYTQYPGRRSLQYSPGFDAPVLVTEKTLTFRNLMGEAIELPILSQGTVVQQKTP